ncbi:MAG TPA: NAD-dependent epimerase/dehydratase family protein [Rubrobacteraceae bacterium]|nr:NAD-dependent epimerase/dehydratase family protein [Rubrobacteraceae bacterium]
MSVVLITGASGLIGSEATRFFARMGHRVIGIDNDMRRYFFGEDASVLRNRNELLQELDNYSHQDVDIRDEKAVARIFQNYGSDVSLIIHAAAQPSHDWAASEPFTDFTVNANGTLVLLECARRFCPEAVFVFLSTNKVYGDTPNHLPLIEQKTRWETDPDHPYHSGIDETMSIDQSKHSLFGASKVAADVLVQEYGRYFGMKTACFRGGCLTGPNHSGAKLHGFLSYLMKCTVTGEPYTILGYKGKQVRDNIHSYDLVNAIYHFYQNPRVGEVYNIGGGRFSNCSMLEAVELCEEIAGKRLHWTYSETNRSGDHVWWISDVSKFKSHYPDWNLQYDIRVILEQIHSQTVETVAKLSSP